MLAPHARRRHLARLACLALCLLIAVPAFAQGADGDFEQRTSTHFILYQDVAIDAAGGFHGSRRFEQQVLRVLEGAYDGVEKWLGLRSGDRIKVVIYDPAIFDQEFRGLFRFPAAGFYHGVIRIRGATAVTDQLSRVLHHELVHAALHNASRALIYPGWVNEGGAEWFEVRVLGKRGISVQEQQVLGELSRTGKLHALQTLNVAAFGRMGPRAASIAYLQSYALIDYLVRNHGGEKALARFYGELIRNKNLDRSLKRTYRLDSGDLERNFLKSLQ
jgi:hypothetical protein